MRNGIWQQLGTGSRKSGLKRGVERAGGSTLGGRRSGLVLGILETSRVTVWSGNTWFQCVSHLLHSRVRQCPQLCIRNSGITYG